MKHTNKAIWLLVSLLIIGVIFVSGCTQQSKTPNCQGVYIEYQSNCCIDANYNNVCDELELNSATDNGISHSINCWSDVQCYNGGAPYRYKCSGQDCQNSYGSAEWCSERCEADKNQCVTYNCFIKYCDQDSDCRAGKRCVDYNCQ